MYLKMNISHLFFHKNAIQQKLVFFSVLIKSTIVSTALLLVVTGCSSRKEDKQRPPINVKTITASIIPTGSGQSYSGTVEAQVETALSFSVAGTIKTLNFHQGQLISSGQILGTVDASTKTSTLNASKAGIQNAQAQLTQAQDAYDRMKMLHDENALSEQKWVMAKENLKRAQAALKQAEAMEQISKKGMNDTRLVAPFSGYISAKLAEVGQNAIPGTPVAKLVRIDQVKVKIAVPEEEISRIRVGSTISFKVAALENASFSGIIREKAVKADPLSHSYEVNAIVQNRDQRLLPGMICEVYTEQGESSNTILLPAELIQVERNNKTFVWTVKNGKAQRTNVTIGKNVGDMITIRGGISPGDKVIAEGQHKVSSGMEVKEQKLWER